MLWPERYADWKAYVLFLFRCSVSWDRTTNYLAVSQKGPGRSSTNERKTSQTRGLRHTADGHHVSGRSVLSPGDTAVTEEGCSATTAVTEGLSLCPLQGPMPKYTCYLQYTALVVVVVVVVVEFFLACDDLSGRFDVSFLACTFFLKWRLARAHLFHAIGQNQSTVAQRTGTTLAECSPTSCMWAHLPGKFPHCARTA